MLALAGLLTIADVLLLIISRRASPLAALVLPPLVASLATGFGLHTAAFIIKGMQGVAPVAAVFIFAILYFGIVTDAGMLDPIVDGILRVVGNRPSRIVPGTALLALLIHLDGSGAVAFLITVPLMLPVYQRLGMDKRVLACAAALATGVNFLPWTGPMIRASAALHVPVSEIFTPLIPADTLTARIKEYFAAPCSALDGGSVILMMRFALLLLVTPLLAQQFDVVLNNGRLIDPASNTDAIRSIGLRAGKIASVSATPLTGKREIDASGLVIAPGFIDIHSHGQTPENYALKAQDGVTTALEMEVGVWPLPPWYQARAGKALINFGASSGYLPALMAVMHDSGTLLPRDLAVTRAPTDEEWRQTLANVKQGIRDGGLGIGVGIAYTPLIGRDKILDLFQLAAPDALCVYVHMRYSGPVEPGVLDALQEVLADAAISGASLHVVHLTSMALKQTPLCLRMIEDAESRGIDVTTEAYPYTAGMTEISSAIFAPGWQERLGGIAFHDLQWAATGERLTAQTFETFRGAGGMVAVHNIPEEEVRLVMADPAVIVASDGIMDHGKGHPRAAGAFARVLATYVRDEHVLSLSNAIRKMSYEPAQRVGLPNKGRIAPGADADIVIFDPATVQDRATYEHPSEPSQGMRYVFVNGTLVVKDGQVQPGVFPGVGLRRVSHPAG